MLDFEYDASREWVQDAACADISPNVFFPDDKLGVESAKRICDQCVVRGECLSFAIETGQKHGIWGGLSEMELRKLVKHSPVSDQNGYDV